jgi:hypothetical protein
MSERKNTFGSWLRRHSLTLVAALGGAAGVAYAVTSDKPAKAAAPQVVITPQVVTTPQIAEPAQPAQELPKDTVTDTVQIALLLDTSSSMDGLINQARAHLWNMVDQMGKMTRVVDGKVRGVKIQLALYEYGNDTLSAKSGYIRQVQAFTGDHDTVSEKLHALFTNGGSEFAGQAITLAVKDLQWSSDPSTMRFVFVAGNEGFDQGPVSAVTAMAAADKKDINVQLILCGDQDDTWNAAAKLAKSDLMTIDQNRVAQHIPSPQDDEILRLGAELNSTYMAYGSAGRASMMRQKEADKSSAAMSPKVALERAQLKSKKGYSNSNWDLVDAISDDGKFLENARDEELPEAMRGKSLEEKKAMVAANAAKRAEIQAKIAKLEVERTKFIEAERAKQGTADAPSLESELMKSTKKTAAKKGYK